MASENIKSNFRAILGATNTGKTYFAFDRMLSYSSGIFGFPLRLLARENYDKAVKMLDKDLVALVTGEEKIIPKKAKYYFCTVESMPKSTNVDFVAIDEVQLASDFERGYIFTEKIINLRGLYETILLGSATIQRILKQLFPDIKIEIRERFSKLSFKKKQNLTKLQPRTAVIAFNVNDVYSIAEVLRSKKGGAAVVLGALSPRTRNAQVEMYENQNVDYLVATDAIGMGLNLNIDNIAFSSFKKFDGKINRKLHLAEIGQIAGRAGRYKSNGTFTITRNAAELDSSSIEAIENSNFDYIKKVYWRNSKIDFSSVSNVLNSLDQNPTLNIFIKKKNAEDEKSFKSLCKDNDVKNYLKSFDNIKTLWDVCSIPDFQKLMTGSYLDFLRNVFIYLMKNNNFLPDYWINENINRLNNITGDIDTLSKRIAHIRTWTYISNCALWIKNRDYWKNISRKIEDKLSDELHNKLKLRFVDVERNKYKDKIKKGDALKVKFIDNKLVEVEGVGVGSLTGFKLIINDNSKLSNSNLALDMAKKSILKIIPEKVNNIIVAPDNAFNLGDIHGQKMDSEVNIYWGDDSIGLLKKGNNIFYPKVNIINADLLESKDREKILKRLQKWIDDNIANLLKPIKEDTNKISKSSAIRSIAYTLFNDLGCTSKKNFPVQVDKFTLDQKKDLANLGIRTGIEYYYLPNFMKKNAIELRALLWKIYNSYNKKNFYPLPKDGRVYFNIECSLPQDYWPAIGYVKINNIALRVDIFERVFYLARQKYRYGSFIESSDLMNLIGCNSNQLKEILLFLNYESITMGNDQLLFIYIPRDFIKKTKLRNHHALKNKNTIKNKFKKIKSESPFAVLEDYFNK